MPPASIPKRPLTTTLTLLALWLIFYGSFTLITPALLDDADSVHAEVAREMLLRHDWVTLYANGIRYLEKAPLLYWAMAASMRLSQLLGHTSAAALAIAARIPLALTVLALAFTLEIFTRHISHTRLCCHPERSEGSREIPSHLNRPTLFPNTFSPSNSSHHTSTRAGLYAALILLSSFGLFLFTRITIPDALLCLWLTLALYAFYLTEHPDRSQDQISPQQSPQTAIDIEHPGVSRLPDTMRLANVADLPNAARLKVPRGFSLGSHTPEEEEGLQPLGYAVRRPHLLSCLAFAASCALAVLTKGLIGLLFPVAIVLTHLLLTRGPRATLQRLRQLHPIASLAIFLAIAAPWHILIALANPTQGHPANLTFTSGHWQVPLPTDGNVHGWAWFYFLNEHLLRYLNLRVPHDYDTVPLTLFLGLILIWLMPWSAFLFQALVHAIRHSSLFHPLRDASTGDAASGPKARHIPAWGEAPGTAQQYPPRAEGPTYTLLLLWAAIPLLFFSFSTRQEYYVLPSLPPLVILIALWLASDTTPKTHRATAVLLTLGTLFAAATLYFLLHTHAPAPNTDLAALLQQNPADYAMSLGHFLDLNQQALALFRLPLALAAAALFLGPLASYLLRRKAHLANSPHHAHAANLALAAGAFTFLLAAHLGLRIFAPILSSQQLATAIASQLQPGDLIVIHQEYEYASTLSFYLQRPTYAEAPSSTSSTTAPTEATPPAASTATIAAPPGTPRLQPWAFQPTQKTGALAPGAGLSPHLTAVNPIHILTDPIHDATPNYGRSSNLWYGSYFPDAPAIFETAQTLGAKWRTPQRIFLWQDLANQPSPLPTNLTPIYVIARSGGKEILSNQPNRP